MPIFYPPGAMLPVESYRVIRVLLFPRAVDDDFVKAKDPFFFGLMSVLNSTNTTYMQLIDEPKAHIPLRACFSGPDTLWL